MADIAATQVSKSASIVATSGQVIQILILNADGSIFQNAIFDTVPINKTFKGFVGYNGTLS